MADETPKNKLNLTLDLRIIIVILLAAIAAMLLIWKPWDSAPNNNDRTIKVTGEATISAEPDEFVFYPSYNFAHDDRKVALENLTKKSTAIVDELKKLGVDDKKIKTNAADYNFGYHYPEKTGEDMFTLSLTVTVGSKELAQKVQDYVKTTVPQGQVTPQPSFSEKKSKELEEQARKEAEKDARNKAEQSAKNIGFKVGKVKSVVENSGYGGPIPYVSRASDAGSIEKGSSLSVQPGENEFQYYVEVVYYIR